MNKTTFLSIVLVSTFISCRAQQTQNRTVSAFNRIQTSGSVNVYYTNSDTMGVSVKADKDEINNVETRIENSTLIITNKGHFDSPVYVYVKNNQLTNIESSGASDLRMTNLVKTDSIGIHVSGSADVHAKIEARKVKCVQGGASSIVLSGSADNFHADVSSAATLKSYDFIVKQADVVTTSAATAKIHVTEKLKANASGASDIKVKGDPAEVAAESTAAASITRIKDASKSQSSGDTTVYTWKRKKFMVVDNLEIDNDGAHKKDTNDSDFKHWAGFYMGVNGFMSSPGNIAIPQPYQYMELNYRRSFNFQFNIIERQVKLVKNYFKLVTGFGFDYHSYDLANKTTLNPDSSFTWGVIDSTNGITYKKNRLRATYLQIPLLLEFNTSNDPDKTFHLAFGVVGQYLIASRTRQVLEQDNDEFTRVRKDGYNMSPFAAKAHVNAGYRGLTVFAEYSLTSLFQSGRGPELYPFTVGVRLVPFS